jgi:2-isopropylmalate synthase
MRGMIDIMTKKIDIFDSTLRDGSQGEGIAFSVADKIGIVKVLDNIGVAYIEAGNPGSNPKDLEFFELVKKTKLETSKLCAFGSTRRCNIKVQEDTNVMNLLTADTPVVAIFGKSWDLHVTKVLKTTLEENLAMIKETVAFFKENGKEVIFDAEHFFDGCKANEEYAFLTLNAANEGGADVLCLCDTNGAAYPTEVFDITQKVLKRFEKRVAIHCHNDTGLATANSMFAADAGATQVQGTFVGFGERCGNANLSTIIPNLQLKRDYECIPQKNLVLLSSAARTISEISNVQLLTSLPYVGSSAFAHKGGMHIDGVNKIPCSFEHIDPEIVGNERRFLMSEVSGRTTILAAINKIDSTLTKDSPQATAVINRIKELEHFGYQFEAAQSSVELLIRKELGSYKPFFELEQYKTLGEQPSENPDHCATAMIKIRVDGKTEITAAQGDGPVHALDTAMKKALVTFYPVLASVRLTDYKVRVMEPRAAAAAKVRVLIESSDGEHVWSNVGVSTDIIEASWLALVDSIEYKLTRDFECRLGKVW